MFPACVTFVGLARGYAALGDTRNPVANWEIAIKNIPENQKVNLPVYEQTLKALREKRLRQRVENLELGRRLPR